MNFCGWSSTTCKGSRKNGVGARGIFVSDEFDAALDIIESDFLEYGDEFQQDMNLAVEKIPTLNNSPSYPCSFCAKVCLSKGGLIRHISTKHHLETAEPNTKVSKMLHPDIFYDINQKSLKTLAQDECYPEEICSQLQL